MKPVRLPLYLLTGFLGSGKTTLLASWLRLPAFADTAVVINEAGAVQIDGTLVGRATENVRVLDSGCVCCAVLDDLGATIENLLDARERAAIPDFSRLVVETSGLADPGPIVASLICDPRLRAQVAYSGTIAVVDGVHGPENLTRYPEARAQLIHAEWVILTKADLLDGDSRAALEQRIGTVNGHAEQRWSSHAQPAAPPDAGSAAAPRKPFLPLATVPPTLAGTVAGLTAFPAQAHTHSSLKAHAFRFGRAIDGAALIEAMDLMEQLLEDDIVRSKSLFLDSHSGTGYAVHSVHGTIDRPEEVEDLDVANTGIVVFTHRTARDRLARILAPFVPIDTDPSPRDAPPTAGHPVLRESPGAEPGSVSGAVQPRPGSW